MFKFGNHPPRSLESFGVVGILGDRSKIYYNAIFSARHIGRISDLLLAKLRELGPDELRFRVVLMFSLYEAYRCQLEALEATPGGLLPEPLVIECGVDDEKIAIGIQFVLPEHEFLNPAQLVEKIASGKASSRVERFISQMVADSDQAVVRIQTETRRVEVLSLLGIPGKMDSTVLSQRRPLEVVVLKAESKVSQIQAEYIELGDLDYARLLKEDGLGSRSERPATGDILAREASEADLLTRITGVTDHIQANDEKILVGSQVEKDSEGSVPSQALDPDAQLARARKRLDLYRGRITQLQAKIEKLEGQRQSEPVLVRAQEASPIPPFPEPLPEEDQGSSLGRKVLSLFKRRKAVGRAAEAPVPDAEVPQVSGDEDFFRDQVKGLEQKIERMRLEAENLKGEMAGTSAKKWADGMVGELLAEKARISELAKRVHLGMRQKELEFRNHETALTEDLRRKEDQLRQKTYALERSKDQISQLQMSIERAKHHHSSTSEEMQLKQKLVLSNKLLQATKDDNSILSKKVEELKGQLLNAQHAASSSKSRPSLDVDLSTLKTKYERVFKQNEEFKRANQLLMEKLSEIQKPKQGVLSTEEVKRKLETAMRFAAGYQKESEQLRLKVEELQREEARLKGELNRANNALRAIKKPGGSNAA